MLTHKINDEISLRLFTEKDTKEFYTLTIDSKAYLKQWLGWLDNINSVEDTAKNIQSRLNELNENNGFPKSFAIIYKGKIAGTIGYSKLDKRNKVGNIGYWLGETYQGKGVMSKAFKAMINYGFEELSLNRIEVRVATGNSKSRALPERFNFTKEGILREAEWLYDHYVDHILYGLLADEWKN